MKRHLYLLPPIISLVAAITFFVFRSHVDIEQPVWLSPESHHTTRYNDAIHCAAGVVEVWVSAHDVAAQCALGGRGRKGIVVHGDAAIWREQ